MSAPMAFTSLSYDRLSLRCILNFIIFMGADALSQAIEVRRRRKMRRRKKSIVVDLDDFNLDAAADALTSSSPSSSSPLPSSSGHARSLRFALFGALVHAPACSLFFGALDARLSGKGWKEVCLKLAADRATLAPALLLVALLWMRVPVSSFLMLDKEDKYSSVSASSLPPACLETLYEQGRKTQSDDKSNNSSNSKRDLVAAAAANALRRLPRAYSLSCLFWVPAHSLGFAAVPARWRVLYVALASLVWNCVLARISSEPAATTATEDLEEEEEERRRRRQRQKQQQQQRRGDPSPSSSLPLFTKRQTRKARWSDSATAGSD